MKIHHATNLPEEWLNTATVFSALGDPTRQRILLLFEPGESVSIKEIVSLFSLSRTAIVHHLGVLEKAGILAYERKGKESLYSLRPGVVFEAVENLRHYILEEFPETYLARKISDGVSS
jgi:DNA-binding transcriptional ArsR family regulator